MKVILIDSDVFEELKRRILDLSEKVLILTKKNRPEGLSNWLDSADVCLALNISKKTLQRLRETGHIAYTRFNKKIYYKPEDIESLIKKGI